MFDKFKKDLRRYLAQALRGLAHDLSQSSVWQARGDSYDILHFARMRAAASSARYFETHASKALIFEGAYQLLEFCVSECKSHAQAISAEGKSPLFLEFGVHRGGTINHLASLLPGETVYGFDVFTGLPEDWRTGFTKGLFAVSKLPEVRPNVELVKGLFSESLPPFLAARPKAKVALLHVDCDLYSSTVDIFQNLAPMLTAGTIICFDEYWNYPGWRMHEFKAWREWVGKHHVTYEYIGFVPASQQMAVRILNIP